MSDRSNWMPVEVHHLVWATIATFCATTVLAVAFDLDGSALSLVFALILCVSLGLARLVGRAQGGGRD